jgi:hypothetical protein
VGPWVGTKVTQGGVGCSRCDTIKNLGVVPEEVKEEAILLVEVAPEEVKKMAILLVGVALVEVVALGL